MDIEKWKSKNILTIFFLCISQNTFFFSFFFNFWTDTFYFGHCNPLTLKSDKHLNVLLLYRPWTKHQGRKNNGNDHQLRKFLIVKQILLVSTFRNVLRIVWRIYILMLGYKRLTHLVYDHKIFLSSCIQVCTLAGTKDEILFH